MEEVVPISKIPFRFTAGKNVSLMNSFKVTIFVKTIFFITLLVELAALLLVDTTQLN